MLGAIVGDIVGSRFEFNNTHRTDFELFAPECGFTDDTVCTVAVADALLRGVDFGPTLHSWCRRYPYPTGGYGGRFRQWIASDDPQPYFSFGNGSGMRVSPCGWIDGPMDDVLEAARQSAACTHNHPEGIKGAQCIVECIRALRDGGGREAVRTIATTSSPDDVRTLVAYTLFVTAVVFGVATISNDNLQDLKTGQLVDSTPWKQQVALVIGVVFGAIVIPPVLSLMQGAFGFAGAPDAGDDALAAPQANLIKHLVQGVLGGDLNWSLLGLGALIGAVVIAIDEILRRTSKYSLPPLAVGMGMYLPTAVTVMIPIGAALGHLYDRWAERTANPERAKRMGTLMATGLIVGESLAGVVYAGIVVAFGGKADPLAIMPEGFAGIAPWVGLVLFVGTLWYLYRGARQESTRD